MQSSDQLYRYLFDQANVRGELVRLQQSYQQILDSYPYPQVIQNLLGELMAATCLLTATLKFEGDIALQLQSEGIVKYAVINGSHDQKLRGVARWDEEQQQLPQRFSELFDKGVLVITITPKQGERYQGMVALDKDCLADCLQSYFEQSEQLATKVMLATSVKEGKAMAAGTLLQVMPTSSAATDTSQLDSFHHLYQLTKTLTDDELFSLPLEDILYRLYHQEEIEVYTPQTVSFQCTCSRQRSAEALKNVAKQELLEIIAAEGDIRMNCQYCHTEYRFDAIDVETAHSGYQGETKLQ